MSKYLDVESLDFDKAYKLYESKCYYDLVEYLKFFALSKARIVFIISEFLTLLRAMKINAVIVTTIFDAHKRKQCELTAGQKIEDLKKFEKKSRENIAAREEDVKRTFIDWFQVCGGTKQMTEQIYKENGRFHGFIDDLKAFTDGEKYYFSQPKTKTGFGSWKYHKFVQDDNYAVGAVCSTYNVGETVKIAVITRDGRNDTIVKIPAIEEIKV